MLDKAHSQIISNESEIKPDKLENSIALIMKTAGFVVEGPDEAVPIKAIVIEIANMCRGFMIERELK